jgi:hypothetical protein
MSGFSAAGLERRAEVAASHVGPTRVPGLVARATASRTRGSTAPNSSPTRDGGRRSAPPVDFVAALILLIAIVAGVRLRKA